MDQKNSPMKNFSWLFLISLFLFSCQQKEKKAAIAKIDKTVSFEKLDSIQIYGPPL